MIPPAAGVSFRLQGMLQSDSGLHLAGTAQSGEEAVERAEELKPEVILMDIRMQRERPGQRLGNRPPPQPGIDFLSLPTR